ncbi:MAG TPA: ImmA/IrrE family metallo-endopeptidase [Thermoanaerobaculia bacterium]
MKNIPIGHHEAADLRTRVDRILRDLGSPEPPVDLTAVRELLRLDRQYYSSSDDSAIREVVHKLTIAGKQILARPTLLLDVVRKAQLSALFIPDRKRILIDAETPTLKQRWYETHEIGHSLAEWHGAFLYGDSEETLSPTCREQLEAEANYAAGQLLFMRERFTQDALDLSRSINSVRDLAKRFGNTITSTLWRYVEEIHHGEPLVGVVTPTTRTDAAWNGHAHLPNRYCIESPAFRERFGQISEQELLQVISSYTTYRRAGPLGDSEVVLVDRNGDRHVFYFETFSNGYSRLTLGIYRRPATLAVLVTAAGAHA